MALAIPDGAYLRGATAAGKDAADSEEDADQSLLHDVAAFGCTRGNSSHFRVANCFHGLWLAQAADDLRLLLVGMDPGSACSRGGDRAVLSEKPLFSAYCSTSQLYSASTWANISGNYPVSSSCLEADCSVPRSEPIPEIMLLIARDACGHLACF